MAILFSDDSYRADKIFSALKSAMPEIDLRKFPDTGDPDAIDYAIIWYPKPGSLQNLPNLKAVFSVAAGVDGILRDATLPDVPLIRSVDPGLTQGMVEYVVYHVLRYHRHQHHYDRQQREAVWKQLPQVPPQKRRIGIMGLGEMGGACAKALRFLKFDLRGWSRSAKKIDGMKTFAGDDALPAFLSETDILVNVLPLTPETHGILNAKNFAALPDGAFLIHAGRGGHMVESDLLAALESGKLTHASLDVFPTEPLPEDSLLWAHPKITLTPHIASITDFAAAARNILNNINLLKSDQPLPGTVDRRRGY